LQVTHESELVVVSEFQERHATQTVRLNFWQMSVFGWTGFNGHTLFPMEKFSGSKFSREANMKQQLRIYTINKNALEQFVQEWREKLVPLREKHGFRVLEAYALPSTSQFVWTMAFDGTDAEWDSADKAYFGSSERLAMQPDPGRLIARMENIFATRVK
jgi:hypothetical protein